MSKTKLELKENDRGLHLNLVYLVDREKDSASTDGDITIQGMTPVELAVCCKVAIESIIEGAFDNEEDKEKMRVLVRNLMEFEEKEDDEE